MISDPASLQIKAGETELAYVWRLGRLRATGALDMTWEQLADVFNKNLREPEEYMTESAYRKKYAVMAQAYDEIFSKRIPSEELAEIKAERLDLEKERIKIADERRVFKNLLRTQAREETFVDQIRRALLNFEYTPLKVEESKYIKYDKGPSLLIPLTDIHCGALIDNIWNKYDNEVMAERFARYAGKIKEIRARHFASDAYVVISEIVSGTIHVMTRIESNENVIEQFINAMNQIMGFLVQMSEMFQNVHVYVAPGNHSRIFPNKEENRKGENIDNLAIYYLKGYLQNVGNVHFHFNDIDESIALFMIDGLKTAAAHGDKDTPENICRHVTEMTGIVPNICLLGHMHTNSLTTVNGGCKVIRSGSISGVDTYCIDKRIKGRPEQAVAVLNADGLECLYDIDLRG